MESLSEYVQRVMGEKYLTAKEVERRSNGAIGDSHVINIANGTTTNLTLERLKGLAAGLGVAPIEIFKVAIGSEPDELNVELVTRVLEKLANPRLSRILILLDRMNQKQVKTLIATADKLVSK